MFIQTHTIEFTIQSAGASLLKSKGFKLQSVGYPVGRWPPVTRTLPVKLTTNTLSMSSSKSGSELSSSSSEDSDTVRGEKRELVIPSPVLLSDADDDGVSPSKYNSAVKKRMADNYLVPNFTSGNNEEE
jgi:hypothetical protein